MKILELAPFSAGICGVWTRVLAESREFANLGHKVTVFSSDIVKGTDEKARCEETTGEVTIKRFKTKANILTKNVTCFNFEKELIKLKPDMVITHLIHPHSFKALKICLKNKIPCYLVTHAPFNVKRKFPLNLAAELYYAVKVRPFLNNFTKIIAITKWEIPYLLKLGVKRYKVIYIPNGMPDEFFSQKRIKPKKDVLFLGRIAPVKDLETLIKAAGLLPEIKFSIVGSAEKDYLRKIKVLTKNLKNVQIYPPIYGLKKKIRLIDEHKIFVLPSKREAMPQALLDAMSRGKIAISSETDGGKELINNGKSGFLFRIGDYKKLAEIIRKNIKGNRAVQNNAIKESKKYSWSRLIKSYFKIFKK